MNKTLILVLTVCLISMQAFAKPAAPYLPSGLTALELEAINNDVRSQWLEAESIRQRVAKLSEESKLMLNDLTERWKTHPSFNKE